MLTASTRGRPATRHGNLLSVRLNPMWFTHWYTDLPYSAESMSVGLDVSKKVYIDEQQTMFLRLGTDRDSSRWKVNLNEVNYLKCLALGKWTYRTTAHVPL